MVDQRVTRPGATPPPRKLHLIHRFHITEALRATLATMEYNELPDGGHETGVIEWVNYCTPDCRSPPRPARHSLPRPTPTPPWRMPG